MTNSLSILVVLLLIFERLQEVNCLALPQVSFTLSFVFLWNKFQMNWKSSCYRMAECSLGLLPGWVGLISSSTVAVAMLEDLEVLPVLAGSSWGIQLTYSPPQKRAVCVCKSRRALQNRFFQFCCLISYKPDGMDMSESMNENSNKKAQMRLGFLADTINCVGCRAHRRG